MSSDADGDTEESCSDGILPARQRYNKWSKAKSIQVQILREGPPPPAGSRRRITVDVGCPDLTLRKGAKHGFTVLRDEVDPAPLSFPEDASRRVVSAEQCRKHHIEFSDAGEKTWICGICGMGCPKQYFLMRHLLADHLDSRNFHCAECSKTFNSRTILRQHTLSTHSEDKRHECTVCQKRFGRLSVLNQHKRTHSDGKPYRCHCGKAFHQKVNLTSHQQRVHRPAPTPRAQNTARRARPPLVYRCLACSVQLESVPLLLQHKLTCLPLLESLRSTVAVHPDTGRRIDAGIARSKHHGLLRKIQSIVSNQEELRRQEPKGKRRVVAGRARSRQQRAPSPTHSLTELLPLRLPKPPLLQLQELLQQQQLEQQLEQNQQQQQQPQDPRRQQNQQQQPSQSHDPQQQQQPATGKMMGVLTAPIRTRSMQLARRRGVQPFVLLQTAGGAEPEPTLAKVLRTADNRELLVPATTEDLCEIRDRQSGGLASHDRNKVDVPVVAIVTQYNDGAGRPRVWVQPPACERPGTSILATSQIDLTPARAEPPPPSPPSPPSVPPQPVPSPVVTSAEPALSMPALSMPDLSMPSGAELLGTAVCAAPSPPNAPLDLPDLPDVSPDGPPTIPAPGSPSKGNPVAVALAAGDVTMETAGGVMEMTGSLAETTSVLTGEVDGGGTIQFVGDVIFSAGELQQSMTSLQPVTSLQPASPILQRVSPLLQPFSSPKSVSVSAAIDTYQILTDAITTGTAASPASVATGGGNALPWATP